MLPKTRTNFRVVIFLVQISLKSETVGFKFSVILGDLTRNDPMSCKLMINVQNDNNITNT